MATPPKRSETLEAYDPAFRRLSGSAQRLHTWVCLRAKRFGCAWGRQKELAAHLGINVRSLQIKQRELERAGLLELRTVRRGNALPTGEIAQHQTTLFYPTTPMMESLKMYDPELHVIRDPSRKICDPKDRGSSSETLFCGSEEIEEEGRVAPFEPESSTVPFQLKLPSIEEVAKHLLLQWQKTLAPHIDLESPQTYRHRELWVTVIVARLKEGFTSEEMEIAIEFVARSKNNTEWERRHVMAVFGDAKRLRVLIEYGMSGATFAPPPKLRPRAKKLDVSPIASTKADQLFELPEINGHEDAQAVMDRIEKEERDARRQAAEAGE